MRLPGFTAAASLGGRGGYRAGGEAAAPRVAAGRVRPQQRLGSCAERALRSNQQCIARCNSIWRRFRGEGHIPVEVCEQACNSEFASNLWACRYNN